MKDTSGIEQYFDRAAPSYDQQTCGRNDWAAPFYLKEEMSERPRMYKKALIVGGGTGHDLDVIKDSCECIDVLDISANMLALMQAKHPSVRAIHADFQAHDFEGDQYDLLVGLGVLEFIEELQPFVQKCALLLCPNAKVILTYEPIIRGYAPQHEAADHVACLDENGNSVANVQVYRRDMMEVAAASQEAGLQITAHFSFRAYALEDNIYYNFVALRN